MTSTFFRVLVWTGARVEELGARHDRDEALRLLRGATQPAALAQGTTVLQHSPRGTLRAAAFARFAAGEVDTAKSTSSKPPRLPPQTPTEILPERTPVAPVVEPVVPIVAKGCDEAEPATRVETMADVEAIIARDDASAERRESGAATCVAKGCDEPQGRARADTALAVIELCPHHRARAHDRATSWGVNLSAAVETLRNGTSARPEGAAPSRRGGRRVRGVTAAKKASEKSASMKRARANSPKIPEGSTPKRAPSPPPMPAAAIDLNDALAIVERNASLIARLGGTANAEQLADVAEAHGGPTAITAALRRVLSVAQGRA